MRLRSRWRFVGVLSGGLCLALMSGPRAIAAAGFFVSAEGDFLSADHVVRRCPAPYVDTMSGRLPLERIASSERLDVALLRAKYRPATFARFPMRPSQSLRGPLTMVRRSGGVGKLRVVKARFAGYAEELGDKLVVRAEQQIIVGDSGSPLVDAGGSLVGMMVAKIADRGAIGIAVDTFTLVDFLAGAGVAIETVEPASKVDKISPEDVAIKFTFRVGCLANLEDATKAGARQTPDE